MKLKVAAELVEQKVGETLTYYGCPSTRWRQIRTNNAQERIIREIRRSTRVVGAFPDGHSALMLVAARLRHQEFILSIRQVSVTGKLDKSCRIFPLRCHAVSFV